MGCTEVESGQGRKAGRAATSMRRLINIVTRKTVSSCIQSFLLISTHTSPGQSMEKENRNVKQLNWGHNNQLSGSFLCELIAELS